MDPVSMGLIGGAIAAPIVGGMIGNRSSKAAYKEQANLMRDLLAQINSIPIPEERMLKLEELKSQGILSPEMEQAYIQQDSELSKIALDPRMREAQIGALTSLQDIANQGGMNLSDRAQLNKVLLDASTTERGMREAGLQQLSRRGMGGSGMSIANALASSQNASQNANQQALDIAGMAQNRALQSLISAGDMGGNIRSQDFAEAAKKAEAQDLINRFNLANRQDVQSRNISSRNNAQAANLAMAQDIANQNVALRNQAKQYNMEAAQRRFNNQMTRAGMMSPAQTNLASMYGQRAQGTQQMWGGIGAGVGQGLGAAGMYAMSRPRTPTAAEANYGAMTMKGSAPQY